MKIVRATGALYALCARVSSARVLTGYSNRGTQRKSRGFRVATAAVAALRAGSSLSHVATARVALVRSAALAGRACAGGVRPGRAAPSRAFNKVERSIADEYSVETELPRQHCRGWPKDRVPRVPLR